MYRIKKGDKVEVITGADKGSRGEVIEVSKDKGRVRVEGAKVVKRHVKPSQQNPQGGIVEKEAFMDISNVMILDPKTDTPTRIGAAFDDQGNKIRIAKKSKEPLD
ncbi:MAG: 50S ribosomal protein L24 [Fibrobacterota bacterium]